MNRSDNYNYSRKSLFYDKELVQSSRITMYITFHCAINNYSEIILDRLTFVFKSEDSSSVFYTVNTGLVKPTAPEVTRQLKEKEERRTNLKAEIRRNTANIYELAKNSASQE